MLVWQNGAVTAVVGFRSGKEWPTRGSGSQIPFVMTFYSADGARGDENKIKNVKTAWLSI